MLPQQTPALRASLGAVPVVDQPRCAVRVGADGHVHAHFLGQLAVAPVQLGTAGVRRHLDRRPVLRGRLQHAPHVDARLRALQHELAHRLAQDGHVRVATPHARSGRSAAADRSRRSRGTTRSRSRTSRGSRRRAAASRRGLASSSTPCRMSKAGFSGAAARSPGAERAPHSGPARPRCATVRKWSLMPRYSRPISCAVATIDDSECAPSVHRLWLCRMPLMSQGRTSWSAADSGNGRREHLVPRRGRAIVMAIAVQGRSGRGEVVVDTGCAPPAGPAAAVSLTTLPAGRNGRERGLHAGLVRRGRLRYDRRPTARRRP